MQGQLVSTEFDGPPHTLDKASRAELQRSMEVLTNGGGFVMRLVGNLSGFASQTLGRTFKAVTAIPQANAAVQNVTEFALRRAFDIAVLRLNEPGEQARSRRLARPIVLMSGAVGGFIGLPGFLPDATVTSLAIMREIARIAQEQGESLTDEETRASCLQVFALAPASHHNQASELNYFSARLMMQGRPLSVLFAEVAARYGFSLSQKFALQAIPILGAVGGASMNTAFLNHYRRVAQAHFAIRRLERVFGQPAVQSASADLH